MKLAVALIPYALVVIYAWLNANMSSLNRELVSHGARQPNEATGQTWEIAYRGGAFRYVTWNEYATFHAPFVMGPLFILAVIWILMDWRKAGVFEMFK